MTTFLREERMRALFPRRRRRRVSCWGFSSAAAHRVAWVERRGRPGSRSRYYVSAEAWSYSKRGARRVRLARMYAPTYHLAVRKAKAWCALPPWRVPAP